MSDASSSSSPSQSTILEKLERDEGDDIVTTIIPKNINSECGKEQAKQAQEQVVSLVWKMIVDSKTRSNWDAFLLQYQDLLLSTIEHDASFLPLSSSSSNVAVATNNGNEKVQNNSQGDFLLYILLRNLFKTNHHSSISNTDLMDQTHLLHYACSKGYRKSTMFIIHQCSFSSCCSSTSSSKNNQFILTLKDLQFHETPLHEAARENQIDIVRLLIHASSHSNSNSGDDNDMKHRLESIPNRQGNLPLFEAIRCGHYDMVQLLVKSYPESVVYTNNCGMAPLHLAAHYGYYMIVKFLLLENANVLVTRDDRGYLPLQCTCDGFSIYSDKRLYAQGIDYIKVFQHILEQGMIQKVNGPNGFGGIFDCHESISFHSSSSSLNHCSYKRRRMENRRQKTPFELIIETLESSNWYNLACIKTILQNVHLLSKQHGPQQRTLLHAAIGKVPVSMIKIIMEYLNMGMAITDDLGRTALMVALENIEELTSYSAQPSTSWWCNEMKYKTPDFHHDDSSEDEFFSLIECMLQNSHGGKESASIHDQNGTFPLHMILKVGQYFPWVLPKSSHQETNRKDGLVKQILDAHVEATNIPDGQSGMYSFMIAAEGLKADLTTIFELLLHNPASINH